MYGDDIHLRLHRIRAERLRQEAREAAARRPGARPLRTRLGWTLVEVGLRLATPRGPHAGLTARLDY
ncbi:hypothetical protein HUT19_25560 [Streptomyces sp. NA02950]|uniref:hypothetical protein n=1 Tax=Streptomyces sp. NA02950 TaxID=2742137 RepID=UPI0015905851|nr:hypothetical protein [Streptomyces sp. NA02950]QKV94701.1 hypothetical protein HUT19_25560 [Streptomyces sp. NA02950]